MPCRRSWVRVPSSAPKKPAGNGGFSLVARRAPRGEMRQASQLLVSLGGCGFVPTSPLRVLWEKSGRNRGALAENPCKYLVFRVLTIAGTTPSASARLDASGERAFAKSLQIRQKQRRVYRAHEDRVVQAAAEPARAGRVAGGLRASRASPLSAYVRALWRLRSSSTPRLGNKRSGRSGYRRCSAAG